MGSIVSRDGRVAALVAQRIQGAVEHALRWVTLTYPIYEAECVTAGNAGARIQARAASGGT